MTKIFNFQNIFLLFVLLLACFIFTFSLSNIPNGVYVDEATIGYNAYSIMTTSRDEFGKQFPIAFRFFGAYTPPLFVYVAVIFIKLLGLNIFSLRIISVIASFLGIFIVYIFVKSLDIYNSKYTKYISTILYITCPWVIFNARLGYEVTLGYVIFSLGCLLIWNKLKTHQISTIGYLLLSISTYIAHTQRYLAPIFILFTAILYRKQLFVVKNKKHLYILLILLFLTQIPNLYLVTTNAFWVKNTNFSILDFISQLLVYFSPSTLFGQSPDINLQHTIPSMSLFYFWLIIPFFIGIYRLFNSQKNDSSKYILLMFLLAPIPGALSGHFISVQRVLTLIIPIILIISLGFDNLYTKFKSVYIHMILAISISFSLILFWRSYYVFFPYQRAIWWSYGYQQLSKVIQDNPNNKYIIDNTRNSSGYIDLLFYLKYPAIEFQKQFTHDFIYKYYDNPPYNANYSFANISLRPIYWQTDIYENQILVGDDLAISEGQIQEHFLIKIFDIKDPTGKTIFAGYQTNPVKKMKDSKNK